MGGRGKWVMGIEEGTCWDEHWVLYGNQFDNKFHILERKKKEITTCTRKSENQRAHTHTHTHTHTHNIHTHKSNCGISSVTTANYSTGILGYRM